MRLVSAELSNAWDKQQSGNFGLYFNKMLSYWEDFQYTVVKENKKEGAKSYTLTETLKPMAGYQISERNDPPQSPFAQHSSVYVASSKPTEEILKKRHIQQASYCRVMEAAGWQSFVIEAELTTPYVSGLGMAHPTETGLVLDHTTGLPYIPAAGQKGVMRLAHIINSLLDSDEEWQALDTLFEKGAVKKEKNRDTGKMEICWQEDNASKTLFGFSEKKDALAGQLVVLDAYPLTTPTLGEEILNPHFMKYYGGDRGPTEDQSPIPVKFLVVKPGARFVFRLLLRRQLANALETDQEKLASLLEKNIHRAITEEGMGAKTALGHGRFAIRGKKEPKIVDEWLYPWRPLVREIENIQDWNWGIFKQKILAKDAKIAEYRQKNEVGAAVQAIAKRLQDANPKKWTEDRDKETREWLASSGIDWQPIGITKADSNKAHPLEIQITIDKINALNDWGAYVQSDLQLENLPKPALTALSQRMKNDWGCSGKKAKKNKKQALQQVNKLLRR